MRLVDKDTKIFDKIREKPIIFSARFLGEDSCMKKTIRFTLNGKPQRLVLDRERRLPESSVFLL
jgi:hypothetical protein